MQAKTKYALAVIVLTVIVLALRIAISYEAPYPSYESYFTLVQADAIRQTGLPLYHDPYSYGGRTYAFSPAYYYVVAFFTLFFKRELVLKLLPNVTMALLVPLLYLIGHSITKSRWASLSAAFFGGFSPILFTSYLNDARPMSLALPLAAATLLALLDLEQRPVRALVAVALLTLFSPTIWFFLGAFLIYVVILAAERMPIRPRYLEAALFTLLVATWYTLITYKEPLHRYGFAILQASLPAAARQASFTEFTLLGALYALGVVPLALGSFALYHAAFEQRTRKVFLVGSLSLVALILSFFQLIPLRLGLLILSLSFIALAAPGLHAIASYLRKTRFPALTGWVIGSFLVLFVLSGLLPALAAGVYPQSSPTADEIAALRWIRHNTPEDAVVLAAPRSGFLVNYEARRKYVADTNYLLVPNPDRTLSDIDLIYTTPSTVAAVERLAHFKVTDILVGPSEHTRYAEFGALMTSACFPSRYRLPRAEVLGVNCTLEVAK